LTTGKLIGVGRAADVYDLGDGKVLRRYRFDFDTQREAGVMEHIRRAGYPVPKVFEAKGNELVMERIAGVTMLQDLARRPWMLWSHAATLADLHRRLAKIAAPPGIRQLSAAPGAQVVHYDLHVENVMLTAGGPVVIDWSGACSGDPNADVVMTWIIMASSQPPGGRWQRILAAAGRDGFLYRFLRDFDRTALRRLLHPLGELRLTDPHVTPEERKVVERLTGARGAGDP
jgi:aminoglycoside phosphotransferase (APT) family kinase protein